MSVEEHGATVFIKEATKHIGKFFYKEEKEISVA
jgi:hypothetical protein